MPHERRRNLKAHPESGGCCDGAEPARPAAAAGGGGVLTAVRGQGVMGIGRETLTAPCEHPGCAEPMTWRAYAAYNADAGENLHPLHARYPMAMVRACDVHIGIILANDCDKPGSTQQWLVVRP